MHLVRSFLSVSGMTFLSRLLGLCRDVAVANVFGAGALTDAFFAAFRLPNMLRRFTAEGVLTQAFVPVYAGKRREDADAAGALAGEMSVFLATALLILSVLCVVAAPWIIAVLAPGLEEPAIAADLFRIVFPYILFVSLLALFAGMLNAAGKFTAAAAAPMLLNIAMIAATLWWAPAFVQPIYALAWGVFLGGMVQLIWIIWHLKRVGLFPQWAIHWSPSPAARKILNLFGQGALGAGSTQINLLINLFIASFFSAGSISWLYYADRLMELPAGLLGAALATVILPALSAHAGNAAAFNTLLDKALRLIVFLALPAAVGLACLSLPLVATLFMSGEFDANDAVMTGRAVMAYSVGVIGLAAVRPLAAAFFSRRDASVPVRSAVAALVMTQLMNGLFVFGLGWAHVGLALSVGLAACLNAFVLLCVLRTRMWYQPPPGWGKFFLCVVTALAAMIAVLLSILPTDEFWLVADLSARVAKLSFCVMTALVVYFGVARICGIRIADFRHSS